MTKKEIYEKCKLKIVDYWGLDLSDISDKSIIGSPPLMFRKKHHFWELTTDYDYFFDDLNYIMACHEELYNKHGNNNFDFTVASYCGLVSDCYSFDPEEIMDYLERRNS